MRRIELSEHFTYRKLIRFVLPSIAMMIFVSIYTVVDGFFVSQFAGKTPFAAINLIIPVVMVMASFGFMFGIGGSALVSKTQGEGRKDDANRYFTMMIALAFITGIILTVVGELTIRPLAIALGATGELLEQSVIYARILIAGITFYLMQNVFSAFMVVALKQKLALILTIAAGVTNIIGDALLVGMLKLGVVGAAVASIAGQFIGGAIPLIYFLSHKGHPAIELVRTKLEIKPMLKACWNGVSELATNLAGSLVAICFNFQFMRLMPNGEDGIAAYGFIMYVAFIFVAIFFGFSQGCSPIISYQYGARNAKEIQNIVNKGYKCIIAASISMFLLSLLLNVPLSQLYLGYDKALFELGKHAFFLFSFSFLTAGVNIYSSALFTAYNNGLLSAIISLLRTVVFEIVCAFVLPLFMGLDGLWFTPLIADILCLIVTITLLIIKNKNYHYFKGEFAVVEEQ